MDSGLVKDKDKKKPSEATKDTQKMKKLNTEES